MSLVSHVYLEGYAGKLRELAGHVDLHLVTPSRFDGAFGHGHVEPLRGQPFGLREYSPRFPFALRTTTRWTLQSQDLGFVGDAPDIVHVENELHSFIVLQALRCRARVAAQAKTVVSVWANLPLRGWRRGLDLISHRCARQVDHFIAGNDAARSMLRAQGIDDARITVLPLVGVDVEAFTPASTQTRDTARAALGIARTDFVVGYAGRFVREKGLADLLAAFRGLRPGGGEPAVRLLLAGDGPMKQELTGGGPEVLVVSPGAHSKVIACLQCMDVLVLPSRTTPHWAEQFGRILVEAMACGVVVAGSTSGAIPEVIGETGVVFPEGDIEQLAAVLDGLRRSPERCQQLAAAGRRRVVAEFSDREIARKTLDVYRRVLGEGRHACV